MINEIKYGGYSAVPSDYECPDGDLAQSLNLINEDGALHPIHQPIQRFHIGRDRKLFIHRTGSVSNYISYQQDTSIIEWIGTESTGKFDTPMHISIPYDIGSIINIASVGYIIIISTSQNIYYIRFNAKKDSYVFLGSKIPDLFLDLALKLNFTLSDIQEKSFEVTTGSGGSGGITGDDDWQTVIIESYDVSSANGELSRENYIYGPDDIHVSTTFIPFDPTFKILPNIEYKFKWDIVAGSHYGMTIGVYGFKNGSEERKLLFWIANELAGAHSIEEKKIFEEEWTNISYIIAFRYPNISSPSCATKGNITWYKGFDNSDSGSEDVSTTIEYTQESHTAIMGAINKYVKELVTDKSRFIYPFFARYAIKLYDGSYSYISEPILMIPNSGYVPAVSFSKHSKLGTRLVMTAFAADLQYKIRGSIPEDWEDLITGIDIFVSEPIWAYNQGQEYDGIKNYFHFTKSVTSLGFGCAYFDEAMCDGNTFSQLELKKYISRYAPNIITNNYVQIAPRSTQDITKDVESVSSFYMICSLGLTELNNAMSDFNDIEIEKGTLSSLVTRETLKDNVLQYQGFRNAYLKEYNNRLHVCHSSIILRPPCHPGNCINHISYFSNNSIITYVFLASEDGKKTINKANNGSVTGPWYFYPDGRAYKAAFVLVDPNNQVTGIAEIELKRHDFLNGAYCYLGDLETMFSFQTAEKDPYMSDNSDSIHALSMVYVSEVNCPFIFKAASAVRIGAQEVIAISSAAKALSQGQFGQFPLYAFSTEGIWALAVSSTGEYSAVQPIVRDETIDIESITQIDSAILFASRRGIMLLSGSEAQSISDIINNDFTFDIMTLKGMEQLHKILGHPSDTCLPIAPFSEFIASCRMLYDYPHQHIIIYNTSKSYAYVYSLKSKTWGMMFSNLVSNVNSYPEALAINSNGALVDFSELNLSVPNDLSPVNALLVTRPLKLDAPDILKTVDCVIQRGYFRKGHVQSVLYGSRDLIHWHIVWSSKDHFMRGFSGSPYKYFRIALICNLSPDESIQGASVQFSPRLTNRLR